MTNFRNRILIPSSTPSFASPEHAEQLIGNLQRNPIYLGKLTSILSKFGQFIEDSYPNIKTTTRGRIKSTYSSSKKLDEPSASGKIDIYDFVALKTVVESVDNGYTSEEKLRQAISELLALGTTHPSAPIILRNLQLILDLKLEDEYETKGIYSWDSFYDFEKKPLKTYRNIDVLLVDRIDRELKMLDSIFDIPAYSKEHIMYLLKQAQIATTYGASIELQQQMKKYILTLKDFGILDRTKHKISENGYAAEHMTILDEELDLPFEYQIKSAENDHIASHGSASHQLRKGKERTLVEIPISVDLPDKDKTRILINTFDKSFIKSVTQTLPRYASYTGNGKTHIYSQWQNFCYYYVDQIRSMSTEQRSFYDVGLQLNPDFTHESEGFHFADQFPYSILPLIYKETENRQTEQSR